MDAGARAQTPRYAPGEEAFGPYVPALLAEWLRDCPRTRYRSFDGTLVFADVSGFTRMTEMLSELGKRGAEEMADSINGTFAKLLEPTRRYGADLIKWGGDATLLLYHGSGHTERACLASHEMQAVMRREGSLRTSRGTVRLRMSIGVHSGRPDFLLVGHEHHRELLVIGHAAGAVTKMEKSADAGEIVVSPETAQALAAGGQAKLLARSGTRLLLRSKPRAELPQQAAGSADFRDVDIGVALCQILRDHVLEGALEPIHRRVTTGFVKFSGVDKLLAQEGPDAACAALDESVRAAQDAAAGNGVAFLATDVDADGARVMLGSGAPRSFGDDEERMLATGRALIEARTALAVRFGASSGRTFAGDYGPPHRRTFSMMGDSVNTAARLMAHAEENQLLVTPGVVEPCNGSFALTPREPFRVKGKREPLQTFSVGPRTQRYRTRDAQDIVGREREFARLLAAQKRAAAGSGSSIELLGQPGIGKTRLLEELERNAVGEVLWAQGDIYAGTRPYAPFATLLRERWGLAEAGAKELAARLKATVTELAPELLPWLPLLGIVAGLDLPSTPEVEQVDPSVRKQRLEEVTSELLGALLDGPTLLVFDDAHLMDDASLDLFARLASDARSRRWLLILSGRPPADEEPAREVGERIVLGPLPPAAIETLLVHATESAPLPPHKLSAVSERAAGNPLFLRELVSQVHAGGDPDSLPQSVEGAIAARIDALAGVQRRALRAAAVLGLVVEPSLLSEVVGDLDSRESAERLLGSLPSFFELQEGVGWRFCQQLLREVAYESLPYGTRTALHARSAEALKRSATLDPGAREELLSLHCFHGARHREAWRHSLVAAENARVRYAKAEAAEIYRRALGAAAHLEGLPLERVASVYESLGDLQVDLGEMQAADSSLRRGLARVREKPRRAVQLQLKLSRLREIEGRYAAGVRWVRRAEGTLDHVRGPGVRALRAQLATRLGRIRYRQARHAEGLRSALDGVAFARASSDRQTLAEALEYADLCDMELGNSAGSRAEEALAIYEEFGAVAAEGRVRNTLGMVAYHEGRWPEALEHYRAAESAYARAGFAWAASLGLANAAELLVDQGRLDEARDALERTLRVWRGVDAAAFVAFGEYELGRVAGRQGRTEEAMALFHAAREHFAASGELTEVAIVDGLTAECLLGVRESEKALALAESTLTRTKSLGGVASAIPLLQRVRGGALLALGQPARARSAYEESLECARARRAQHELAFTLRALVDSGLASAAEEEAGWSKELARLVRGLDLCL